MDAGVAAAPGPVDVAAEVGLGGISARTWTANVADHDADGDKDWFLVRHNPQWFWTGAGTEPFSTLFVNQESGTGGPVFNGTDFAAPRASERDRHDCDFADVDGSEADRRQDLFCAIGLDDDSTNELWTQGATGGLQDSSASFGLTAPGGGGNYRTTTFIHANSDEFPDVYVTRYYGPDGAPLNDPAEDPPVPNELWINQNGTSFQRAADSYGLNTAIGAQKDTPGCTQAVDFNGDADQDLLVCAYKSVKLYRNNGNSTFSDVTTAFAVGGFWKDARIVDLGGTVSRDIVQLRAGSLVVKLWDGAKWATRYSNALTAGETLATGDIDGDGDEDIYVVRTCASGANQPDLVYLNGGTGATFTKVPLPSGVPGCGNDVERVDYDGDGSDDFIVLNGKQKKPGPVQLFTWR
jgi:hypothetical protein